MAKSWKGVESRIAKRIGTRRTPLSGSNSRHTASDTLHPDLFVEVKSWKNVPLWDELTELRARGKYRGLDPLFILQEKGEESDPLIVTEFDTALEFDEMELLTLPEFSDHFLLSHDVQARSPYFDLWRETVEGAVNEHKRPIFVVCKNNSSIQWSITNPDWWSESWTWDRNPDVPGEWGEP